MMNIQYLKKWKKKTSNPLHNRRKNEYCNKKEKCSTVLLVKNKKKPINGAFLEIYLSLFLKLIFVISGRDTTFNTNLFYNI